MMQLQWLNERSHFLLELLTSLAFLAVTSWRQTKLAMVPAVLAFAGVVYAVGMHVYLMKEYWLNKTISSSIGLFTEAILYISGACTYPLMIAYLLKNKFVPTLRKGVLALPCSPHGDEYWPSWLRKLENDAARVVGARVTAGRQVRVETDDDQATDIDRARSGRSPEISPIHLRTSDHRSYGAMDYRPLLVRCSSSADLPSSGEGVKGHDKSNSGNLCGARNVNHFYVTCRDGELRSVWTLAAVVVGIALASSMVSFDLAYQRIFDEAHIRAFFKNDTVSSVEQGFYWAYVWFVFFGVYASVTACCIFHSLTVVERRAIAAAAVVLPMKKTLVEARGLIDEVRKFLKEMTGTMRYWFVVHNFCFFLLTVLLTFEWLEASNKHIVDNQYALMWGSQGNKFIETDDTRSKVDNLKKRSKRKLKLYLVGIIRNNLVQVRLPNVVSK